MDDPINLARIRKESKDDDLTIVASYVMENIQEIKTLKAVLTRVLIQERTIRELEEEIERLTRKKK